MFSASALVLLSSQNTTSPLQRVDRSKSQSRHNGLLVGQGTRLEGDRRSAHNLHGDGHCRHQERYTDPHVPQVKLRAHPLACYHRSHQPLGTHRPPHSSSVVTLTHCSGSPPTASDPGTCWSGHRMRLLECGFVSSFFLACPTAHIRHRINYPQRFVRDSTSFVRMWRVPRAWKATLSATRGVSL